LSEENQETTTQEFEYNDGLGEFLQEKDKPEFSWGKTAIIIGSIVVVLILFLGFSFNIGKQLWLKKNNNNNIKQIEKFGHEDITQRINDIEKEKKRMIEKIEADVEPPTLITNQSTNDTDTLPKPILITPKPKRTIPDTPAPQKKQNNVSVTIKNTPALTVTQISKSELLPKPSVQPTKAIEISKKSIAGKPITIQSPIKQKPIVLSNIPKNDKQEIPQTEITSKKAEITSKNVQKENEEKIIPPTKKIQSTAVIQKPIKRAFFLPSRYPFKVIVGSFSDKKNADEFKKQLSARHFEAYIWVYHGEGKKYYRVQVGAFKTREQAIEYIDTIKKDGLDAYIVKK